MSRNGRTDAGFTLVAAMVLAGVVATLVAAYSRHVIVKSWSSMASESAMGARDECWSNLDYARHALLTGQPIAVSMQDEGAGATSIQVSALSGDHKSLTVTTVRSDGRDATRLVEAALLPSAAAAPATPDALPRIPMDVVTALLFDPTVTKTYFSGDTSISDMDLYGLVILEDQAVLHLSNVVIHGAVVSETTMSGDAFGVFDWSDAPTLVVDGNLRIDGGAFLPGVAVLMPDGVVATGPYDARVQIMGDVVAHTVGLDLPGALHGNVLSVASPQLDDDLEPIGAHRKPKEWSSDLELGTTWEAEFLAVVPNVPTLAELDDIINYWAP